MSKTMDTADSGSLSSANGFTPVDGFLSRTREHPQLVDLAAGINANDGKHRFEEYHFVELSRRFGPVRLDIRRSCRNPQCGTDPRRTRKRLCVFSLFQQSSPSGCRSQLRINIDQCTMTIVCHIWYFSIFCEFCVSQYYLRKCLPISSAHRFPSKNR